MISALRQTRCRIVVVRDRRAGVVIALRYVFETKHPDLCIRIYDSRFIVFENSPLVSVTLIAPPADHGLVSLAEASR